MDLELTHDNPQFTFLPCQETFGGQNVGHPPGLYPQKAPTPTPYVDSLYFRL